MPAHIPVPIIISVLKHAKHSAIPQCGIIAREGRDHFVCLLGLVSCPTWFFWSLFLGNSNILFAMDREQESLVILMPET
jgi:hypothetical protein